MQIFLARNNVQAGPYSLEQLNTMLATGEVVLSDLAWHQGMATWQPVGELTGGQYHYQPNMAHNTQATDAQATNTQTANPQSTTQSKRLTVAQLYGNQPTAQPNTTTSTATSTQANNPQSTSPKQTTTAVYASISSRLLAFGLNMVAFILTTLPLQMAIVRTGFDSQQLQSIKSTADYLALSERLAQQIDPNVSTMTLVMVLVFVLVQLFLIIKRGQSLGKMVVGIRVVDATTHTLPASRHLVGIRTIALFVIYQIASLVNPMAMILLAVNYFLAATHPKKQGWHDRLAKTVVVKVDASQLRPSKSPKN